MASFLEALGVHPRVRRFFKNYISETCEALIIEQDNYFEHAGESFHRIPITEATWTAGDHGLASHIFICGSAMDAIAWLHLNHFRFRSFDHLLFISTGAVPNSNLNDAAPLQNNTQNKKIHLLYSNEPLGAICDIKMASFIRKFPIKIRANENDFIVTFRSESYTIKNLSLHSLEKAARFHFNIRTHKPKKHTTFYEQLKHRHRT